MPGSDKNGFGSMSVEDRIRLAEQIYVIYPRNEQIMAKIAHCHRHSRDSAEPECMLIKGDTGAGKTTLYRRYEQNYPRVETAERTFVPVLSATIPVPATSKSLVTKLLVKLGDPLAEKGTLINQTLRLYGLLRSCGVELLILDEFQHFIDRDSNKILQTISDWLKELLNETRIPIVLIGMPNCDVVLNANSQLRRRFAVREKLEPFIWSHKDMEVQKQERQNFRKFLASVDKQLPLAERSNLADPDTAYLIHCATGGKVSSIVNLIRRAVAISLKQGDERITMDTLAAAYADRLAAEQPNLENPFLS